MKKLFFLGALFLLFVESDKCLGSNQDSNSDFEFENFLNDVIEDAPVFKKNLNEVSENATVRSEQFDEQKTYSSIIKTSEGIDRLHKQIADLRADLATLDKRISELENDKKNLEQENTGLKEKVEVSLMQSQTAIDIEIELQMLRAKYNKKLIQLEELEKQVKSLQDENSTLLQLNQDLTLEVNELHTTIFTMTQMAEEQNGTILKLNREVADFNDDCTDWQNEAKDTAKIIHEIKKIRKVIKKQLKEGNQLQYRLDELLASKAELEKFHDQVTILSMDDSQLDEFADSMNEAVAKLEISVTNAKHQVNNLCLKLRALDHKISEQKISNGDSDMDNSDETKMLEQTILRLETDRPQLNSMRKAELESNSLPKNWSDRFLPKLNDLEKMYREQTEQDLNVSVLVLLLKSYESLNPKIQKAEKRLIKKVKEESAHIQSLNNQRVQSLNEYDIAAKIEKKRKKDYWWNQALTRLDELQEKKAKLESELSEIQSKIQYLSELLNSKTLLLQSLQKNNSSSSSGSELSPTYLGADNDKWSPIKNSHNSHIGLNGSPL